jgi:hypothetical protein
MGTYAADLLKGSTIVIIFRYLLNNKPIYLFILNKLISEESAPACHHIRHK